MRNPNNSSRLVVVVLLLASALVGLVVGVVTLVQRDREELITRMAVERQGPLELASRSVSESLGDVADVLKLANELLGQPGTESEHERELRAVLLAVAQDKAIAVFRADGAERFLLVDPQAGDPVVHGVYTPSMREQGRAALAAAPGQITVSNALERQSWVRVFATALDQKAGGGSIAVLVDTEPFFAPIRVLGDSDGRLLLIGPNGMSSPLSDPTLSRWYANAARSALVPSLSQSIDKVRGGTAGSARIAEDEAEKLELSRASAVAVFTPIAMKRGPSWSAMRLESTGALRSHERQVLLRASLGAFLAAVFLTAFAIYAVLASRRAVALQESERHAQQLAQILDHIPAGVLVLRADGRVSTTNQALKARLPGIAPGMALASAFPEATPPLVTRLQELLRGALDAAQARSLLGDEVPLFGGDGQYNLHAVPLEGGDPDARALLVVEDLSSIRALESQLLRAEKMATVGVLAAGIAHEIGTPLGVVRGRAEYLQKKLGPENPNANGVTVIIEQIDHVSKTIRQLLDFSRLKPAAVHPVDVGAALKHAGELLQLEIEKRGVSLEIEIAPNLQKIAADADQLQQVLVNLTLNACDASERGDVVKLSARPDLAQEGAWGTVCLTVEDRGHGIPAEHLHQIFDPFFTTKKRGQGTGLGLTIVAQIVRNHGGRIEVKSALGTGTQFLLHWPASHD